MNVTNRPSGDGEVEPVHRAEDILGTGTTAKIVLGHQTYILRLTRAGKLILTK